MDLLKVALIYHCHYSASEQIAKQYELTQVRALLVSCATNSMVSEHGTLVREEHLPI